MTTTTTGLEGLDSLGLVEAALTLPEQLEAGLVAGREVGMLPAHDDIEHVLLLGVGDAALTGAATVTTAGPFMAVPIMVCSTFSPPAFVGEGTLCIALSRRGDTEEVVEAAQATALAGARMIVVTSSEGRLAELGRAWHAGVIELPESIPAARVALGAFIGPLVGILERVGLWPGASSYLEAAIEQARARVAAVGTAADPTPELARSIGRTLPLIYGGGDLGHVAARSWKSQINQNAKVPAFANALPELAHGEIGGWGQHGDVTRQVFTLLNLRHDQEHPSVMNRFAVSRGLLDEVVSQTLDVEAAGDGALAQLLDLMFLGQITSLRMALREGIDPGPVPAIDLVTEAPAD